MAAALDPEPSPSLSSPSSPPSRRERPPKVVFVLGSQRSGTNALRRCISLSPRVAGYNEVARDRWYEDWQLRPETEIGAAVRREWAPVVLFKPIVNLLHTAVGDLLDDWRDHEVQVAWIYRDPVDVYHSRARRWPDLDDVDGFLAEWHRVNAPVVDAVDDDGRISIVRYEDLASDGHVLWSLFRRLGARGENLFRAGPSTARERLAPTTIDRIATGTRELVAELDARRTFVPSRAGGA